MLIGARSLCPCGQALHYPEPTLRTYMVRQTSRFGPMVHVLTTVGSWRIPRHYLVLHGGIRPFELGLLAVHFGWHPVR